MTQYPELWNALAADIPPERIKERKAGGNRMVPYITARVVMNRLDSVVGFENWWDDYVVDPGGSDNILCRLTIRLPDGSTVTKSDTGSPGSTGDDGEDEKGAFSDALKRAAVKFGIGRHLYGDGCYMVKQPKRPVAATAQTVPVAIPSPPFTTTGGFREWAESRLVTERAHVIATELRYPGSWMAWTLNQCREVYLAIMEHEAEDAAVGAPS
jgi:hypothetical protein